MGKRSLFGGIIVVLAIIAGSVFLLRGCLSKYDERSALPPALYFEKDNKGIVFTIIQYGIATSYKSGPGGTFKSMSTSYYIQSNDAATGEVIATKEMKDNSDIKFHPVTVMGTGNGRAWFFMNELLAYDPFTLEKFADKEMIEAKNPQLKGKMPDEKRYYEYDQPTEAVLITATDGIKYTLSTANLRATAVDEDAVAKNPVEAQIKLLKKNEAALEERFKSYYDRYSEFNRLYSERKITAAAYFDSSKKFNRQQDTISEMKKKYSDDIRDLEGLGRADKSRQRQIDNFKTSGKNYTNICTAVDTFHGKWYGMLSSADLEKPLTDFNYRPVYIETARNKFYRAAVTLKDSTKKAVELQVAEPEKMNETVYLQGGFLLDKATALPIHVKSEDGFIICYREKVGNDGNIILARIDLMGKALWTYNTNLSNFADWIYTGKRLIILGNDNKEISSGDANLLISIDLQNGKAVLYDYFTKRLR